MERARCYGSPVETSYTKLYNKIKLEISEHDSTHQLHLKTVPLILIFHRPLPPSPLRSKTSCLHKSASVPPKTNTIGPKRLTVNSVVSCLLIPRDQTHKKVTKTPSVKTMPIVTSINLTAASVYK